MPIRQPPAEHGTPVNEVIRKMGFCEQTFYRWKKQYSGMDTSELRKVKKFEEESLRETLGHARLQFRVEGKGNTDPTVCAAAVQDHSTHGVEDRRQAHRSRKAAGAVGRAHYDIALFGGEMGDQGRPACHAQS